ncbi:MAG: sulfotransferase [Fidelibacterota bacterium]
MSDKKVNLFIVGVNKSGTSWLYHVLKEHPQINMSDRKELYYFGNEYPNSLEEYHAHFDFKNEYLYYGEATPTYYRDLKVAQQIKSYNPLAKLIIIVRDPIERFLSQYYFQKQIGSISERTTLVQFLNGDTRFLLSDSHYENTIPAYIELFDSEQFFVHSLEAVKADPESFWQEITEFLGVESLALPLPRNQSENPTGSKWFRKIYRTTVQPIKNSNYALYEAMLRIRVFRKIKLILLKMTGFAKKKDLSIEVQKRLLTEFLPTYHYLETLNIFGISLPEFSKEKGFED